MGNVRLLQSGDFLGGQFQRECGDGVVEVLLLGRANDGRGDQRFVQQPGKRDLRPRHTALLRDLSHPLDHPAV